MENKIIPDFDVSVKFGEYNSPSFESVIETIQKVVPGKQFISFEFIVDELYGDTLTEEEKAEEVKRLKEINNMESIDVNTLFTHDVPVDEDI